MTISPEQNIYLEVKLVGLKLKLKVDLIELVCGRFPSVDFDKPLLFFKKNTRFS